MSRYDGDTKKWTKDCGECPYRDRAFCKWGVAIKILLQDMNNGRRCEYRHREPSGDSAYRQNRILIRKGHSQVSRGNNQLGLF